MARWRAIFCSLLGWGLVKLLLGPQSVGVQFFLGLDAFLGQLPIILFSLIGGVFADRTNRRTLLLISQAVQLTCAFLLALLFYLNVVQVWHILCLSFTVGVAQAFGGPAYQALIPSLVSPKELSNAIALNSIQFNLARIIGPMLGGIALNKLGATWCFSFNGISFVAVIISLLLIAPRFNPQKSNESVLDSMNKGIMFIRQQGAMTSLIALAFCMTLLGIPLTVFLPVFAKEVFKQGSETFTLLLCCSGAGSVAGALFIAGISKRKNQGRSALFALIILGVCITGFALSRILILSCVLIFVAGAALIAGFALISSLVQAITGDEMRGRVMSIYNVAFRGGMPIGSLLIGSLSHSFPTPFVLAGNGVLLVIVSLYFLAVHRRVAAL